MDKDYSRVKELYTKIRFLNHRIKFLKQKASQAGKKSVVDELGSGQIAKKRELLNRFTESIEGNPSQIDQIQKQFLNIYNSCMERINYLESEIFMNKWWDINNNRNSSPHNGSANS